MGKITVIIADDIKETRDNIKLLLSLDNEIKVVDEASNGEEAIEKCKELRPNIILMDVNMPQMDGIKAARVVSAQVPETSIIMISVQGEVEYLKKAMASGAKGFLVKPFTGDELLQNIKDVYNTEKSKKRVVEENKEIKTKYISVFSTKGGVGKTTIATNLAVNLSRLTEDRIIIVDLNLQFGDVSLFLNETPQKTMVDMVEDVNEVDYALVEKYIITHSSGIDILPAPKKPEQSEYIKSDFVKKVLEVLDKHYQYVIIDTATGFNDMALIALDYSDIILYISNLDLSSIKNAKLGFGLLRSLDYPEEKIKFIVNKSNDQYGIKYQDVVSTIDRSVDLWLPEDYKTVVTSLNKGSSFVTVRGNTKIAKKVRELTSIVLDKEDKNEGGFLRKVLG